MVRITRLLLLACALSTAGAAACGDQTPSATPGASGDDGGDGTGDEGGTGDGGTTADGQVTPANPDNISIIVEPSDKATALLAAVNAATKSIHMTMYLLDDKRFISALIAKHAAGVDVKVVLNQTFPDNSTSNAAVYAQLQSGGVGVVWASAAYTLTHEKCILIDGTSAWIMTMNLESSSPTNREFLALDTAPTDIAEAEAVFQADYVSAAVTPAGALLVAPVNARSQLVTLIQGATSTVDLEGEELSDSMIVNALIAAKAAKRTVRVVLADNTPTASQSAAVSKLKAALIPTVSVGTPYIHAKAVVVDGARAYVGSENFTTGSLQYNRELGIVTNNPVAAGKVGAAIAADFAAGSAL